MNGSLLIKGGTLITSDANDSVVAGDLLVRDGRIVAVGEVAESADEVIDARDCAVVPGFVQTHVHFCQTLFRGAADDLPLIDWLKRRIGLCGAAHPPAPARASARLA